MTKYFSCIVADPPWGFKDRLSSMKSPVKRSAVSQYEVLSVGEIQRLRINDLADPAGCVLALWVPSVFLPDGLETMRQWGFTFKQTFIWTKMKNKVAKDADINDETRFGMGRLFRQAHEIALIGTLGKNVYKNIVSKSQRSVAFDVNKGHSIKTELLQNRLEMMFPTSKKLEIFARRIRQGWTCIGDGVTGIDVRTSIEDLI
jgi:N6-adenosine-specific RNA methylase IME4